ncbi:MAG: FAD-dependent monooxygenase [Anaerolineales bacterium]|nr:FAD-dependent monooxygenase [Anaerolineales bacterium]
MKILVLGGGPGGLYAALLLKKANPEFDIQVVERNPAGATYGWGVVFSDRTITTFREADFVTYEKITQEFVSWTDIDVHYRGQVVRAGGHDFAGMSRRRLLKILQDRCRELEIDLLFEQEAVWLQIEGDEPLQENELNASLEKIAQDRTFSSGVSPYPIYPDHYDLVIAADGVNSATRSRFAEFFQPEITPGRAKFIWFGTDRLLDAFSFIFKENEHGLFQVHAYPFDGRTSTFIVECAQEVWERAGLDQADEHESIAYCEGLFADFLGGARLLSNRSVWVNFLHVECRNWRYKNVILLGDAAHTAHFSIGSGTKLAMDAAISLAQSIEAASDLDQSLRLYQMDRRPRAAALQAAALVSQDYFENLKRYTHLDPEPFAFQLLTRSGRIHYDNLRTRDPYYVDRLDRQFADAPLAPPPMHTPFNLKGVLVRNRIASMEIHSGAGLVLSKPAAVAVDGLIADNGDGLFDDTTRDLWRSWIEDVNQSGALAGLVLNHAGRRACGVFGTQGTARATELIAPSAIPYDRLSRQPREADAADLDRICSAFVDAAGRARDLGADVLIVHMAHGYLLSSFLSPLTNKRADRLGGSLENRAGFPLQVVDAVRHNWEGPLGAVLHVDDWMRDGFCLDDAVKVGLMLRENGCDFLQPLAGQMVPNDRAVFGPGYLVPFAERLRHEVGLPVLVGGYLTTSGEVNTILAGGRADLCIMSPARA